MYIQDLIDRDTPKKPKEQEIIYGTSQGPLTTIKYFCPRCGVIVHEEVNDFCGNCGQRLEWGDTDDVD